MDELQTDTSESKRGDKGGSNGLTIGLILVIVYFFCPFIYILPLTLFYSKSRPPEIVFDAIKVYLAPISALEKLIPGYSVLINTEARILENIFFR